MIDPEVEKRALAIAVFPASVLANKAILSFVEDDAEETLLSQSLRLLVTLSTPSAVPLVLAAMTGDGDLDVLSLENKLAEPTELALQGLDRSLVAFVQHAFTEPLVPVEASDISWKSLQQIAQSPGVSIRVCEMLGAAVGLKAALALTATLVFLAPPLFFACVVAGASAGILTEWGIRRIQGDRPGLREDLNRLGEGERKQAIRDAMKMADLVSGLSVPATASGDEVDQYFELLIRRSMPGGPHDRARRRIHERVGSSWTELEEKLHELAGVPVGASREALLEGLRSNVGAPKDARTKDILRAAVLYLLSTKPPGDQKRTRSTT